MKGSIRIFLIAGAVLALALSVWSGVKAAKGPADNGNSIFNNAFFSQVLGVNSSNLQAPANSRVKTDVMDVTETPQVGEDATPEATETPEVGEDNQGQNEQSATPQATKVASSEGNNGEVTGTISIVDASTITINGVVYNLATSSEIKGMLQAGATVKLEFVTNSDGTLSVTEVKVSNEQNKNQDGSNQSGSNSSGDNNGGSNSGSQSNGDGDGGGNGSGDGGSGN